MKINFILSGPINYININYKIFILNKFYNLILRLNQVMGSKFHIRKIGMRS